MRYSIVAIVLLLAPVRSADSFVGSGAAKGLWDMEALKKAPKMTVAATEEIKEGGVDVSLSSLYYEGEPWMGKPTRVFAYYARPARIDRKIPAMVLVHGGGGQAFAEWARIWAGRGYAALSMDLGGRGPGRAAMPDGGPDQSDEWKFFRLKDGLTNAWPYQSVAAVIRGISLLRSMREVDSRKIGITGISWGGYLTSIVMSLDDRLKAAIPVYGCGFLYENSAWLGHFARLPEYERKLWIGNFDPSQYLPRCRIPVLWMNGTNDFAYPLDSYQRSYRASPGPRTLCVTVKMPHGHREGWARQEIYDFADSIFGIRGAKRFGIIEPIKVEGNAVKLKYRSQVPISSVQIHWTSDLGKPWQQREWASADGEIVNDRLARATAPAARPAVFFLTITDSRDLVVSSEHAELR